MTDQPWLSFGPARVLDNHKGNPRFPRIAKPAHGSQRANIGPQFGELRKALDAERLKIADPTAEVDPELIVVFVLAAPLDSFRRAAESAGIEYLAQLPLDELSVESGFSTDSGRPITGYAHGVVTNAQAAQQLITCFNLWQKNPKCKLDRGLAPLKEVFSHLHQIRRWDATDRVRETGLMEVWRESVAAVGGSYSPRVVELELWYRASPEGRMQAQNTATAVVHATSGKVLAHCHVPEIRYHGLLVELSAQDVENALTSGAQSIRTLLVDEIQFASSAEGMALLGSDFVAGIDEDLASPPAADPSAKAQPLAALLDGLPNGNHPLLAGRVRLDDPESLAGAYPVALRRHGTAMASLIIWGDLNEGNAPIPEPLYVLPVLRSHEWRDAEVVPRDRLMVDMVHAAFVRMFDGPQPTAPSVRVVNLSIGAPERTFIRSMSPLARLLDWLSEKYNVLVVVSAGNHPIPLNLGPETLGATHDELARRAFASVRDTSRTLGLLSPAEATNVMTIGAAHSDLSSPPQSDVLLDLGVGNGPATYSGHGYGFNRSVKPDVIAPGGRVFHLRPVDSSTVATPAKAGPSGPGQRVAASRDLTSNTTTFTAGTSNAAALATRQATDLFRALRNYATPIVDPMYDPLAVRALMAHSARWSPPHQALETVADMSRKEAAKFIGYGLLDPAHLLSSDPHRAVVIGAATIAVGERHEYDVPIPPSLHALTEWRRLKITLAWFTTPGRSSTSYVQSRLTLDFPASSHTWGTRHGVVDDQTTGGTLTQYTIEGKKAIARAPGDAWTIGIESRAAESASKKTTTRYALVASIEVADTLLVDVQAEVRDALTLRVRQSAAQVRGGP